MTLIPYSGKDTRYEVPFSTTFRRGAPVARARPAGKNPVVPVINDEEARRLAVRAIFRKRGAPTWVIDLIEEVSLRTGVKMELIASKKRSFRIVYARNDAIYSVKDAKKSLSTPVIAKWFDRDHTAVLHSIASHSDRTGAPELVGYQLNRARKRSAALQAFYRKRERAAA